MRTRIDILLICAVMLASARLKYQLSVIVSTAFFE